MIQNTSLRLHTTIKSEQVAKKSETDSGITMLRLRMWLNTHIYTHTYKEGLIFINVVDWWWCMLYWSYTKERNKEGNSTFTFALFPKSARNQFERALVEHACIETAFLILTQYNFGFAETKAISTKKLELAYE